MLRKNGANNIFHFCLVHFPKIYMTVYQDIIFFINTRDFKRQEFFIDTCNEIKTGYYINVLRSFPFTIINVFKQEYHDDL